VLRRRPHLTRTTIGLLLAVAVWLGLLAAAFWAIGRPRTRVWLAQEISRRLTEAAGQPVRIADVQLSLNPPRVVLRGVEVGPPSAPVLKVNTADVLVGDVRIASREIEIDNLRVAGVWLDLQSFPRPRGASAPWFRVVVRQLELQDLEVKRIAIPGGVVISARDVEARWSGSRRAPISAAVVHVGSFTLSAPGVEAISGTLVAWGREAEGGWELGRVRGRGAGWAVDATGDEAGGALRARGTLRLELAQLDRTLHIQTGLEGLVDVDWRASLRGPDFRVDSDVLARKVTVAGLEFRDLVGQAHVSPEGLEASVSRVTFAGGRLEGSYALGGFGPPWSHRIAVRGEGVDLARFLQALGANDAGLSASARVSAEVAWNGTHFKQGAGTGIADLAPGPGDVPGDGRVVVTLAGDGVLAFDTKDLVVAGAPVHWAGGLTLGSWVPSWTVQGTGVPVSAIARLLRGWVGTDVLPPALRGEAALDLSIRGPFSDIEVGGTVAVAPIAFGPVEADGLRASFLAGHGVLSVSSGVVVVGAGQVNVTGDLRYAAGAELRFALAGEKVPLARMVAWGGVHAPLAGDVKIEGTLTGTIAAPQADARIELTRVAVAGVAFGAGAGHLNLKDRVVTLSGLVVGPFSAGARVDLGRREAEVDAKLSGFGLDAISPPLARMAGGALDCTLHGSFPFDSPAGVLEVTSAKGAHGRLELDANGLHVELARPDVWHLEGDVRHSGSEFRGKIEFGVDSWRALAEDLAGAELPIDGRMAGDAELTFAPPQLPRLNGVIRTLDVVVEGERASLEKPAPFDIEGGAIHLAGATLVGTRSNLFVRVGRSSDGTLSGNVSGELPAALLALVWRDARPSGRIEMLGEISGTDSAPRFEGTARVTDGSLRIPGIAEPVTHVSGVMEFSPEAIRLDGLDFYMLGGTGVCEGRVVLSPQLELDLAMRVKTIRWPLMLGLTPILTGDVRLVGPLANLSLSGSAVLNRTAFRRDLDLQKLVVEQLRAPERARVTEASPIALNISVNIPGTLEIETTLAHLSLRGDLRVVGTTARYGVLGRLEALPGGELNFSGVQYELDRGSVTFTSPDRIEPVLDVLARTTVQSYDITVALVGPLDHMTPTFSSSPALPEMDIVSLLFVGTTAQQASGSQTGAMASSFLTSALTGAVTNRARTLLDVDQLQIDPFASTQSGSPTARLTVAKQLSRTWNVTVSTNLTSNREEIVTSRWRLGQGIYLVTSREADGSYSMEVKWQRRY
jgi:TamB, inner membrane protein subunit of TAM complex